MFFLETLQLNLIATQTLMFYNQVLFLAAMTDFWIHPPGGRSSQAIVDGAMNTLRALVKERLSGKSGGSGYNKQVDPVVNPCSTVFVAFIWNWKDQTLHWTWLSNTELPSSSRAAVAVRRKWSTSLMTTSTRWCWRVMTCGWWSSSPLGVDTAKSELGTSPSPAVRNSEHPPHYEGGDLSYQTAEVYGNVVEKVHNQCFLFTSLFVSYSQFSLTFALFCCQ